MMASALIIVRTLVGDLKRFCINLRYRAKLRENGLTSARSSIISVYSIKSIETGKNCTLGAFSVIDVCNLYAANESDAKLVLGDSVYIGDHCNVRASGAIIHIGSNTLIGNSTVIVSTNHGTKVGILIDKQPWDTKLSGVRIGSDCWIGSNTTILPGAVIEDGCIIAAGAVVRGTIPTNTIWGGVPARFIRQR